MLKYYYEDDDRSPSEWFNRILNFDFYLDIENFSEVDLLKVVSKK